MNRRSFLKAGGMTTAAFALGATGLLSLGGMDKTLASPRSRGSFGGYGPLAKDPGGVLDLPRGFQYRIISEEGKKLSDGRPIPELFDGMAAFKGKNNSTILVRNHEITSTTNNPVIGKNPYNKNYNGGTTALIVGPDR